MNTWIALFRGINVGGTNKLPMKDLVASLSKLGYENVQSYIQSGNVVFRSAEKSAQKLASQIAATVKKTNGFEPKIFVLSAKSLATAIAANPYKKAERNHKSLHLYFLAEPAKHAKLAELDKLKSGDEAFSLKESVFYLHAPDGIGKSKLAERVERLLGVATTARNWRTVCTLLAMAQT
jgi:uncharacterized protein (DUF1697 family)